MTRILIGLLLTTLVLACRQERTISNEAGSGISALPTFTMDPDRTYQTIHNFGASDAWACQIVGKNWPAPKKEQIADYLFSLEMKPDGSPQGIGLSGWRFNIGGGSWFQGENSDIEDTWRRAEGFMRPDGSLDWSQQAGQRWFLRAAQKRGVAQFSGFVNSPPVALTRNGKAYSAGGKNGNLSPENYGAFADYLALVVKKLADQDGVFLDYLSPFNEPQWDWNKPGQEGSPWTNEEIFSITKEVDRALLEQKLATRIEITEAGTLKALYQLDEKDPERSDQIRTFFQPSSPFYLGALSRIAPKIAGHSYFTTWPSEKLIRVRESLHQTLQSVDPNLEFWMTEYCILENNDFIEGGGRDLGMDAALFMARVIHADLVVAHANTWQWWLAISPYNFKDGLVFVDQEEQDGQIYDSKSLWVLGNYARFIRPGMKRIRVERSDLLSLSESIEGLLVSAFQDTVSRQIVAVLINQEYRERPVKLDLKKPSDLAPLFYLTSASEEDDLRRVDLAYEAGALKVPPRSVLTAVFDWTNK